MLTKETISTLATKYGGVKTNTGASATQVAILTEEIKVLTKHFANNKKDLHSRRGFIAKIEKRKALLAYLRTTDFATYQHVIAELGLRK